MTRGILFDERAIVALRELLPGPAIDAFGLITHLGDGALLVAVVLFLYWFRHDRRREGGFAVAVGIGGLALAVGLKALFERPRPAEELHLFVETGYGFPSAHALGAAVLWGLLALTLDVGTRRIRYGVSVAIVAAVALSRVVLGVHYPGDVLAGTVIGFAWVWFAFRYARGDPEPVFALAVVLSAFGGLGAGSEYGYVAVGASVGGVVGWRLVADRAVVPSTAAMLILAACSLATIAALRAVTAAALVHPLVEAAGTVVGVVVALSAPFAAARIDHTAPVRTVDAVLRLLVRGQR